MGACCSSNVCEVPTPADKPIINVDKTNPPPTTAITTTATTTATATAATATTTTAQAKSLLETNNTTNVPTTTTRSTPSLAKLSRKLSSSRGHRKVTPRGAQGEGSDSSDLEAEDDGPARRRDEPLIVLFHRKQSPQASYDVDEFKALGVLGSGEFGKVQLVQDPRDGQTYALKTISKAHLKKMGKEEIVKNEWSIQSQLDHPFISKLYGALEDEENIYLVLEPSMGGELFSLLQQRKPFDMQWTQFYVASVILALQYLHEKQIIYRDLKPENILLDAQGFIQLCDFGCAKKMTHMLLRTFSEVGTPAYSCPEMVAGEGHNNGMDWWDVGVLLFELITGVTPFVDAKGEDAMAERIKRVDYTFPNSFPKTEQATQAKDLIKKLLQKNPDKRLGINKEALEQLKAHPFFKGFDWRRLSDRQMAPPFVPQLKDQFDLSRFHIDWSAKT